MRSELWSAYVRAVVPRGEKQMVTAEKVGQSQATISRWKNSLSSPDDPADVAAFANAYDHNVLEAFIAAGLLDVRGAGRGLPEKSKKFLAELGDETQDDGKAATKAAFERGLNRNPPAEPQSPPVEKVKRVRRRA